MSVVSEAYVQGASNRRVDTLAQSMGLEGISKPWASKRAKSLDTAVVESHHRPLDVGPRGCLRLDAIGLKCREGERVVNVAGLAATAVNADGRREILALDVVSSENGAGLPA